MSEQEMAQDKVDPPLSDEAIRAMQQARFQERVERVLAVMRRERVDFRGLPFIGDDGRIGVRVVPIEMPEQPQT